MLNPCHKVGDLVAVIDDRLNSGMSLGIITGTEMSIGKS